MHNILVSAGLLPSSPWRGQALSIRPRLGPGPLARTLGLATLAVALGSVTALSVPRSEPLGQPEARQGREGGPASNLLRPALMAPASSLRPAHPLVPEALTRSVFRGWGDGLGPADDWREEEFTQVEVVDGRTLRAGERRIRLAGLVLPLPEQVCRTPDGRPEPCWARAAMQLELLTRWRRVTCRYRMQEAGEAVGYCRVGSSDLAGRMLMTGYAWQVSNAQAPSTGGAPL